ncbi:MAG: hypothetical protein ACRDGD_01865 [Candidatus Limnocylindria bacterium]
MSAIHTACAGCPPVPPATPAELVLAGLIALVPVLIFGLVVAALDRYAS